MTLLSNTVIKQYLGTAIIIDPFREELLNNVSYDLTLGTHAAFFKNPQEIEGVPTGPAVMLALQEANKKEEAGEDLSEDDLRSLGYWMPHLDDPRDRYTIVNFSDVGYLAVGPGQRILCHSQEVAGGRVAGVKLDDALGMTKMVAVTTSLQATSTAARLGLSVCDDAGWGDVGFISRWTFELTNRSMYPIVLPVGARLAQLSFHEVKPPIEGTDYDDVGQYMDADREWTPEDMLPKKMKVLR